MRAALIVVAFVGFLATHAAASDQAPRWPWAHVRWGNEAGRLLLAEGVRRSTLIGTLLRDLERTDVMVYVTVMMTPTGSQEAAAHLAFGAAAGKIRYLMVTVDRWRAGAWDAIPLLGHELQHALEVAGAPDVRDVRSFERLYYRIGWQTGAGAYETDLARSTGRRIQAELHWAKADRPVLPAKE